MSDIHVETSAVIPAPAEQVYAIIADYHVGHPAILPKPYFTEMTIKEGGTGAGTVAEVRMNVFGVKRVYHLTTSEPEPGRVLAETDEAAGVTTTFTVDSLDGGEQARVTIRTQARLSPGIMGLMEKLFNPAIMRRIYQKELQQLAAYLQSIQGT